VELDAISEGGTIGTSSPRRMAAIRARTSGLIASPIRGNIDSRIQKVRSGEYAGAILAAAGLNRIGRQGDIAQYFEVTDFLPAPAQGALAVECRSDNQEMIELLSGIDDARTRLTSIAERAVLQGLNAGCDLPIGAFAYVEGEELVLLAELGDLATGKNQKIQKSIKITSINDFNAAQNLGFTVARQFVR
jgi:hydroxymethylbilane synthase